MKLSDFMYDLPEERIAQTPVEPRSSSRMLCLDRATGALSHHHFYELGQFLRPGDLLVMIEEEEHKDFIRQDSDLIYNLLLDMPTAVLGGQVQIPTLTGDVKITITPGTQPGKVLRMRGKGLPRIDQYGRSYGQGDLLINVGVYIPEKLNKDERKLIEQLQNSPNIAPGAGEKKSFFHNLFGI